MKDISNGLEYKPIPCEPVYSSSQPCFPEHFRYITRNIPGPGVDTGMFEDKLHGCHCQQGCQDQTCPCLDHFGPTYHSQTGQLLPDVVRSSSLKPVMECNSQCICDTSCPNRVVQKGLKMRLTVAPSGGRGFGLFTCEDILRLTFVCEYAGEVIGVSEARERLEKAEGGMNYLIVLQEHCSSGVVLTCVDPRLMGNIGRFANHSCDPNLLMVPVRVDNSVPRLALFARRNITAGEELTFDYSGETMLELLDSSGAGCELLKSDKGKEVTNFDKTVKPYLPEAGENYSKEAELGCSDLPLARPEFMKRDSGEEMSDKFSVSFDQTVKPQSREIKVTLKGDLHQNVEFQTSHNHGHNEVVNDDLEEASVIDASSDSSSVVDTDFDRDNVKQVSAVHGAVCSINRRKRKLSNDEEEKNASQILTRYSDTVSKRKAESIQCDRKPCLCGSQCCKGYLPLDSLVFDS